MDFTEQLFFSRPLSVFFEELMGEFQMISIRLVVIMPTADHVGNVFLSNFQIVDR